MTAPRGSADAPEVVLDLSRLLSRITKLTPTGVDRVEMAYARGLLAAMPGRLSFAALHPNGVYGRLEHGAVLHFLDRTEATWSNAGRGAGWRRWLHAARALLLLHPRRVPPRPGGRARIYVQASPHHLDNQARVAQILRRESARFLCLVHDLIPIEYPEYARAGGADRHRRRITTIMRHADGIITNSAATRRSLAPFLAASSRTPLVRVAHLGVPAEYLLASAPATVARPYFVCIGTIEPRKNHLLLLNIWRRMVEEGGETPIPRLVLIGRRGWENEQVVDMLERSPALRGHVEEHGRLTDREARRLLEGARALLMPSFAEGYGLPVSEALALNTPVICSDLLALRESGGSAPTYLDPLDGIGWLAAIRAANSADRAAPRPTAQPVELSSWAGHIAIVEDLVHRLAS